jgi:hypothetical protein
VVTEYQARMDQALKSSVRYDVHPEMLMPADMLANWRRRVKRLQRAGVRATNQGDAKRVLMIQQAHIRLVIGKYP